MSRNTGRRKRQPFGVLRRKMTIDSATQAKLKSSNLVPRWINDEGNRLFEAQEGDYDFVSNPGASVKTGEAETETDNRISMNVGKNQDGSSKKAYLMAIPEEYYKEDCAAKETINKRVDTAIKGGTPGGLDPHGIKPESGSTRVSKVDYKP
jgi:hypothetical protein